MLFLDTSSRLYGPLGTVENVLKKLQKTKKGEKKPRESLLFLSFLATRQAASTTIHTKFGHLLAMNLHSTGHIHIHVFFFSMIPFIHGLCQC